MSRRKAVIGALLVLALVMVIVGAVFGGKPALVQELLTIQQVDYVRVAHEQPGEHRLQFKRLAQEQEDAMLAILKDCRFIKQEERYYLGEQDIALYIILGGENDQGEKNWNDLIFYADGSLHIHTEKGEHFVVIDEEHLTRLCAVLDDL